MDSGKMKVESGKRLIDRQAAIDKLMKIGVMASSSKTRTVAMCISAVELLPTVDAMEVETVRHGAWKLVGADKRGRGGVWKCTADGCGDLTPYKSDYCPNCGARMDLGGADNGK